MADETPKVAGDQTDDTTLPAEHDADAPRTDFTSDEESQVSEQPAAVEEEELTPEFVRYENRRIDLILAGGALLLAFFVSSFKDTSPDIWLRFRTGQLVAETFPNIPKTDPLSYTAGDRAWINPSWLFDWTAYSAYQLDGGVTLVVVKALLVTLTACLVLIIRHRGPTLGWTSSCTVLALTTMGTWLTLEPATLGLLLLGLLLWLWFQARYRGRFRLIYLAVPLTILWANVDLTFVMVPLILLLAAVGEFVQAYLPESCDFGTARFDTSKSVQTLLVGGLCILAGLATPYGWNSLAFPFEWLIQVLPQVPGLELSVSGWVGLADAGRNRDFGWAIQAWSALSILALGSFFLNIAKFSVSRLFMATLAVAMPFVAVRFMAPSALLLAVALSLNGQEFFLANWGTETRVDRGWVFWSQGTRAAMVIAVFVAVFAGLTGRVQGITARFGFGVPLDQCAVDAVKWLDEVKPKGNGFAFVERIASYRVWAQSGAKNFADSRWHLFADRKGEEQSNFLKQYSEARQSLAGRTAQQVWKDVFEPHNISYVIVDPKDPPDMLVAAQALFASTDFATVRISDNAIIFGRIDKSPDGELFSKHQIDANRLVFRESSDPPPAPPYDASEPAWYIDPVWRVREVVPSHYWTGRTYYVGGTNQSNASLAMRQPGSTILAIRALRAASAAKPDNPNSYVYQGLAYTNLLENELLAFAQADRDRMIASEQKRIEEDKGKAKTKPATGQDQAKDAPKTSIVDETDPEFVKARLEHVRNQPLQTPPSGQLLTMRHYQTMTAFQLAVTAGAKGRDARQAHVYLYSLSRKNNYLDLALNHLHAAIELASDVALSGGELKDLNDAAKTLESEIKKQRELYKAECDRMLEMFVAEGMEGDRPFERAQLAVRHGLPLLAIEQLEEISIMSPEMARVHPFAGQLLLTLGQPDEAMRYLESAQSSQFAHPADLDWYLALIHAVKGRYDTARSTLEQAIAKVRVSRTTRLLSGFEARIRGIGLHAVPSEINATVTDMEEREAIYLFTLGLLRMELGEPKRALKEFHQLFTLAPRYFLRPIVALYWTHLTDEKIPDQPPDVKMEDLIATSYAEAKSDDSKESGTPSQAEKRPPNGDAPKKDEANTPKRNTQDSQKTPKDQPPSSPPAKAKDATETGAPKSKKTAGQQGL